MFILPIQKAQIKLDQIVALQKHLQDHIVIQAKGQAITPHQDRVLVFHQDKVLVLHQEV